MMAASTLLSAPALQPDDLAASQSALPSEPALRPEGLAASTSAIDLCKMLDERMSSTKAHVQVLQEVSKVEEHVVLAAQAHEACVGVLAAASVEKKSTVIRVEAAAAMHGAAVQAKRCANAALLLSAKRYKLAVAMQVLLSSVDD